jgi:phosphoribosylglycinamide formyltransferase-1
MEHFQANNSAEVIAVFSNKKQAGVHERAQRYGVPSFSFSKEQFHRRDGVLAHMQGLQVDWIILAGFLWLIPQSIVEEFQNRIVNIHPALLPKYGGKGMYGKHVHAAVKENNERESGITIHYVNPQYDEGQIILQARCGISIDDSAEQIAKKVLKLEHFFFPRTIQFLISNELN